MSYQENKTYRQFVEGCIEGIKEDYFYPGSDMDLSDAIHQNVDNHVIYYADQDFILRHTSNEDAFFEITGERIEADSFQEVKTQLAYWALYQDVSEEIDAERWEEIRDYLEERRSRKAA